MSYRRPADLVRENTEDKPEIYEERQERAARLEAESREEFLKQQQEKQQEENE